MQAPRREDARDNQKSGGRQRRSKPRTHGIVRSISHVGHHERARRHTHNGSNGVVPELESAETRGVVERVEWNDRQQAQDRDRHQATLLQQPIHGLGSALDESRRPFTPDGPSDPECGARPQGCPNHRYSKPHPQPEHSPRRQRAQGSWEHENDQQEVEGDKGHRPPRGLGGPIEPIAHRICSEHSHRDRQAGKDDQKHRQADNGGSGPHGDLSAQDDGRDIVPARVHGMIMPQNEVHYMMRYLADRLRKFERESRPVDPETAQALKSRWDAMPATSKVPGQLIGRKSAGCEATHGVFPKCNFSCKPCYHSADANKVRIDGPHTLREIDRQMGFLREKRGNGQFAQLIGGEVSLLEARDHGDAIALMRRHGRMPMSFTHGDFDYDYLRAVVTDDNDSPRFNWVSFACHMDTTMVGRTGIKKPQSEAELNEYRGRFCQMFDRLKDEYGIRSYLAHNMTVTRDNVDQIPDVIRQCHGQGWRMFSFQPAAYIGNENRWSEGYRELDSDSVWGQVEAGAGTALNYGAMQFGDTRCNRVTWGAYVGDAYTPMLDDSDPRDHKAVDDFMTAFPGNFAHRRPLETTVRVIRSLASHPAVIPSTVGQLRRFVQRSGGLGQDWRTLHPVTFVLHQFIDAADTAVAWQHMKDGTRATEPRIVEAQERLEACAYSMGHPDTDELVPACVQHGILDIEENRKLVQLLPLPTRRNG